MRDKKLNLSLQSIRCWMVFCASLVGSFALLGWSENASAQCTTSSTDCIVNNTTVTLGGVRRYRNVSVTNNGRILVTPFNGTDRVNTGNLEIIAETILVDASSSIDARGAGYSTLRCADGRGPTATSGGRGGCAVYDSGGGGGHFGLGGRGTRDCFLYPGDETPTAAICHFPNEYQQDCGNSLNGAGDTCTATSDCQNLSTFNGSPGTAGQPYFHNVYQPEFGASGGDKGCRDGDGFGGSPMVAGSGGGRIVLVGLRSNNTGTVQIAGTVTTAGRRGCGDGNDSGGGGAGGTVLIVGDQVQIDGTARVLANGGLGGDTNAMSSPEASDCPAGAQAPGGTCDDCGGGGGGGLITVLSRSKNLASGATFNVSGAFGGTCEICKGEAGGGPGELQLEGAYVGEYCDGFDNDFDGQTDEMLGTVTCGLGTCAQNINACASGAPVTCMPTTTSATCLAGRDGAKPRISVILDSSGSMLLNLAGYPTFGDGSATRPGIDLDGNSQPDDSRLFLAKRSLREVISAYPEIDFSLARYHQDQGTNRSCATGTWFECAGIPASYDNPRNNLGATSCTVATSPTTNEVIRVDPNGDQCINYAGSCGAPRRGADVLAGFGSRTVDITRWLDGRESNFIASETTGNVCNHAGGGDCELRGSGPTPLAGSLQAIEDYIVPIRSTDPQADCRTYAVILVTDGAESCNGNPVTAASRLFGMFGVETYVVAVSVRPTEEASLNAIAAAGSGGTRQAIFVRQPDELVPAITSIIEGSIRFERCNGLDDDCDGEIDETFTDKNEICNDGRIGVCRGNGRRQCRMDGSATECRITAPGASPAAETCNSMDDDCDEAIDEGLSCTGTCVPTGPEVCNGADDDCNGLVDETDPRAGMMCGMSQGICLPGLTRCVGGEIICVGGTDPRTEICNGLDDDCDGIADDMAECPAETFCIQGACRRPCDPEIEFPCPPGFGCNIASDDMYYCVPSICSTCAPNEECINDTCIDRCDGVSCGTGERCQRGNCINCHTFGCADGQVCFDGQCQANSCATVDCGSQACVNGVCQAPCGPSDCPAGERCTASGACETNPCVSESCGMGRVCLNGGCELDPCRTISCGLGEVCAAGTGCIPNPCSVVECPEGRACSVDPRGFALCASTAQPEPPKETVYVVAQGGKCSIDPARSSGTCWSIFGLAISLMWVRRRQKRVHRNRTGETRGFRVCSTMSAISIAVVCVSSGCNVEPYCLRCESGDARNDGSTDSSSVDSGVRDTSRPDIGTIDSGSLCNQPEACNGLDDDCDRNIDEGFDFTSNPLHCGRCNSECRIPFAEVACTNGECQQTGCLPGYVDRDPTMPGCEYRCPIFPTLNHEECNGIDDNCDGRVDEPEALQMPSVSFCRQVAGTLCNNVPLSCEMRGNITTWFCNYPTGIEFDPTVPNGIVLEESKCDGIDNDCDGLADEPFTLNTVCDNGLRGACRDVGRVVCDPSDPSATTCDLSVLPDARPGAPQFEVCNGEDDNCDGIVDNPSPTDPARVVEDMVHIVRGGSDFWIYKYEASRPDATSSAVGAMDHRSCSRAGVQPWTSVSYAQAQAACTSVGMRLCTGAEWQAACQGASTRVYPYSSTYQAATCNGGDRDAIAGGSFDTRVEATGALAMCVGTDGAFDMSGNVKEWTNDQRGSSESGTPIYVVRGGSHQSPEYGLTCQTDLSRATTDTLLPSLGFRCCSNRAP